MEFSVLLFFVVIETQCATVSNDDFELIICSHLEHLVSLVGKDVEKSKAVSGPSACLDHFLNNNIVLRVYLFIFSI